MEENIPSLLTEQQCKDLGKQIVVIIKRLGEVQSQLETKSTLSSALTKISEDYGRKNESELAQYRQVNLHLTIYALNKLESGVLCANVFKTLKTTPSMNVMRGLLNPKDFREVEEIAEAKANWRRTRSRKMLNFCSSW